MKRCLLFLFFLFPFLLSAQSWNQIGQDIDGAQGGSSGASLDGDLSGRSISISSDGEIIAIGAPRHGFTSYDIGFGHVRVYIKNGSGWTQLGQDIDGENQDDQSGYSVSISNDGYTIAIGAPYNDGNGSNSGHVRIHNYNGTSWNQLGGDIDGEANGDVSGHSVSLSSDGNTVAIGASHDVRVYNWDSNSWNQKGNDIQEESTGDNGGVVSISSDGNTVAIGAPYNDGNGSQAGHVRIYNWNGTSWNQLGNDIDGEAAGDYSGWSVSLSSDGNTVAIGAPYQLNGNGPSSGHVRIFNWDGVSWIQLGQDIDGYPSGSMLGWSVSLSSDAEKLAIGAYDNIQTGGNWSGYTSIYSWNGFSWVQLGQDINGEAYGDHAAFVSLSDDGNTVAIGARFNDGNGYNAGHVRIYNFTNPGCTDSLACNYDSLATIDDSSCVYPTSSTTTVTACDSVVWNGTTYTQSGTYSYNGGGTPSNISGFTYAGNYNGSDYYISDTSDSWTNANSICNNNNANLVTIADSNEYNFIKTIIDSFQVGVWIGLYQDTSSINYSEPNGGWQWVTGENLTFLSWASSEPNNSTNNPEICETYAEMNSVTHLWYDQWNTPNSFHYILEIPAQLTNTNGCDSTAILNLTINQGDTSYTNITACDSLIWNGTTYTQSGTYTYSSGVNNNYSMSFDGNDDYINCGQALSNNILSNNATWMAWVNCNDLNTPQIISSKWVNSQNTQWAFGRYHQNNLSGEFYLTLRASNGNYNAHYSNGFNLQINEWSHISIVWNLDSLYFYKNGVLLNVEYTGQYSLRQTSGDLLIGAQNSSPHEYFWNGKLDDIQIWNKALTQDEIQNYLNCPPENNEIGLIRYWSFEEGSGTTAYDQTSNGNNGTINGAAYDTNVPSQSCPLTNANGCDSVAILNLTITGSDTSYTNITACDSVVWNGTTYDSSGTYSTNIGSNNNYSMSFDGITGDNIDINHINGLNNQISISGWMLFNDISNQDCIIEKNSSNSGWYLRKENDKLRWAANTVNGQMNNESSSTIPIGSYVYISATYDGINSKIYINGLECSGSGSTLSNPGGDIISNLNSIALGIGRWGSQSNGIYTSMLMDGNIGNISIWDVALSEQDIQQYMTCPPTGNEFGLVGFWDFEEGSGTTAIDLTGNGNNGTINGATYDTNVPSQSCNLTNVNGCDSTAILNLTINNAVTTSNTVSICSGDSFTVGTSTYNTDGTYTDVLTTIDGCDSTVTTILTLDPLGCTDANAFNYDPNAICDDGSCIATVNGCTDPTACNYNPNATVDDGSCLYSTSGSEFIAICYGYNWNGDSLTQSGTYTDTLTAANGCDSIATLSLIIMQICGCTDSTAINYNPIATVDDSSCIPFIYGCTNAGFYNYNPQANTDDGSCIDSCGFYGYDDELTISTGGHNNGMNSSWYLLNSNGDTLLYEQTPSSWFSSSQSICVSTGCYYISFVSWNAGNVYFTMYNNSGNIVYQDAGLWSLEEVVPISIGVQSCPAPVVGCSDSLALNYNATANINDGSCFYFLNGCTDSTMWNYNPIANIDDSSCIPFIYGCTDAGFYNYNPQANTDDGTCIDSCGFYGYDDEFTVNFSHGWGAGNSYTGDHSNWFLLDIDGDTLLSELGPYSPWYTSSQNVCVSSGCYYILFENWEGGNQDSLHVDVTNNNTNWWNPLYTTQWNNPCNTWPCGNVAALVSVNTTNCPVPVVGCTDLAAVNYDSIANVNDGSCYYCDITASISLINPSNGTTCDGFLAATPISSYPTISYSWVDSSGIVVNNTNFIPNSCNGLYSLTIVDTAGCIFDTTFMSGYIYGCTDSTACNYNLNATIDDSSCLLIYGCIDFSACNYDSSVTCDDGSCIFPSTSIDSISSCDSYLWNGITYASSGTYNYNGSSASIFISTLISHYSNLKIL